MSEGQPVLTLEDEALLREIVTHDTERGIFESTYPTARIAAVLAELAREREARERMELAHRARVKMHTDAEARVRELEADLAVYERAVQTALGRAPNHWQKYRDPFELGPEIQDARTRGREALVGLPERREDT